MRIIKTNEHLSKQIKIIIVMIMENKNNSETRKKYDNEKKRKIRRACAVPPANWERPQAQTHIKMMRITEINE